MPAHALPRLSAHRPPSDRMGLELALLEGIFPAAPEPVAEALVPQATRRHVLVADDDGDLRQYVRSCLEPHFWVTEAADGADAFAKAVRLRPALVVTDALMPPAGGDGLCRALRADLHLCAVPILAISGEMGGLDGADAFLPKPFTRQQLVAAVHALVGPTV